MNLQQKVDTYLDSQRFLLSAGNLSLLDLQELCPICRGKKGSDFDFCYQCNGHIRNAGVNNWRLADRTAFICYGEAKGKDQLGSDMHNYKKNEIQQPLQSEAKRRIVSLLYHTFSHYWDEANTPEITVLTAMPSLRDVNRNQLMQLVKNVASRLPNNLEAYSVAGGMGFGWWLVEHYLPYHVDCPNSCGLGEPTRGRKDPPYFQVGYGSFDNIPDLIDPLVKSSLPA